MTKRRLAAIAVLDVVGYSAMMAEDEEGTHATLKAHRSEIAPILLNHGSRVVKSTGDGYLVEIPSVVEALQAAVEIQELMVERNTAVPENMRLELRIGINLGDIIIEDDGDVYGDGVNVAARLEGLADPGGICVSESVRQQVGNRLEIGFEDMGHVEVKNIPVPVHAWRVVLDGIEAPRSKHTAKGGYHLATVAVLPFDNMSRNPRTSTRQTGSPKTSSPHSPGTGTCEFWQGTPPSRTKPRHKTSETSPESWTQPMSSKAASAEQVTGSG